MLGCETPGQSALVALGAGGAAGGAGLAFGATPGVVVAVAATLAVGGELLAHTVRSDEGWRAAVARLRGEVR